MNRIYLQAPTLARGPPQINQGLGTPSCTTPQMKASFCGLFRTNLWELNFLRVLKFLQDLFFKLTLRLCKWKEWSKAKMREKNQEREKQQQKNRRGHQLKNEPKLTETSEKQVTASKVINKE